MIYKMILLSAIIGFLFTLAFPVIPNSISADFAPEVAASTRFVATTGTDSGNCTSSESPCQMIQYAVNQSFSGDTILVAQGTYTYNAATEVCADLNTRAIVCVRNKTLTILGGYSTSDWSVSKPDVNLTVIDGQSTYRGAHVHKNSGVTTHLDMEGFTIQNCRAIGNASTPEAIGAGILVQIASITLRDMIFDNNQSIGSNTSSNAGGQADGSAIRIYNESSANSSLIQRVIFNNNQSRSGTGPERGGVALGTIYIYRSPVTIEDSVFTNNLAQAGNSNGDGEYFGLNADAIGGAIAIMNSVVSISGTTVSGNQVIGGNASTSTGTGGHALGGGIFIEKLSNPSDTTSVTITNSIIANNTATAGSARKGGIAGGGGLDSDDSQVIIEGVQVINNSAIGGNSASGVEAGAASGGGLYIFAKTAGVPASTFKNVLIADNYLNQGTTGNQSPGSGGGGGMNLQGVSAEITHATIARNRLGPTYGLGQGLVVQTSWNPIPYPSVTLNNSIISDHTDGASWASAILIGTSATLTFNYGIFAGNEDDIGGDGTHNNDESMTTLGAGIPVGYISPGSPNYNYHLRSDSVVKDAATHSTTSADFEGQSRPYGSTRDFGADEYWSFTFIASPRNSALILDWSADIAFLQGGVDHYVVNVTCPPGANPPTQGSCGSYINAGTGTSFALTGLSNFYTYTITVYARDNANVTMASSNNVAATPTNLISYIPLIGK